MANRLLLFTPGPDSDSANPHRISNNDGYFLQVLYKDIVQQEETSAEWSIEMYKEKRGIASRLFEQKAIYIIISICIFASFGLP